VSSRIEFILYSGILSGNVKGNYMSEAERIPITVGVVGHLDVLATDEQRREVRDFFFDLGTAYPSSPVYLFSSIAEGADRFVARIFLDLKHGHDNFRNRFELIVPTPFNTDEYKNDFSDASKQEFEALLYQAKRNICICCDDDKATRPEKYLRAGKFVADSSIILIALWDGKEGKKGGTADIVRHKITGDNENVAESTFEYDGTVFVIPSGRTGSASIGAAATEHSLSLELVLKDDEIKKTLEKIEEINSSSVRLDDSALSRSKDSFFTSHGKLDAQQISLLEWYSVLDVFSLHFHKQDRKITVWLFIIGFFLVSAIEVYSNLLISDFILGIVMLFAFLATAVYLYSKTTGNHTKYLYFRTLAEALRIQFYWNMAGINKNVADSILRIHRKDFTWIKYIMSAIYGATFSNRKITAESINDLIVNWVKDQSRFFSSSIMDMTRKLKLLNAISNTSFIIGSALLVSIFFAGDFYKSHNYMNLLLVINGMLIGLFALLKGYIKMKGYEQLLNQYELMYVIYSRAESKANETETYNLTPEMRNDYLKELFFVVGKEALIENGNWYLIFKEREPEIKGI
jgi:hypothetical protein